MRKSKIIKKTTYSVDKENRVVICTIECDLGLVNHPAWCSLQDRFWTKGLPKVDWKGRFTVKGKSRCGLTDEFDESRGKLIALARAEAKMYRTAGKVFSLCGDGLGDLMVKCHETAESFFDSKHRSEMNLHELLEQ